MKKIMGLVFLLLLLVSATGFAETGIGVTAHYPIIMGVGGGDPELDDFWVGASLRTKQSILLLDLSALYALNGIAAGGILDIGVCFDLFMFRIAVLGGIDLKYYLVDVLERENFYWGPNVKANVDLKLGPVTAGLSGIIPLTRFISDDEHRKDSLLTFAGVSLNVIFWF